VIRPRHRRLVVEPMDELKPETVIEIVQFDKFNTKSSGLESKSWTRGRVIAIGSDCDPVNGANVGDIVHFTKNGGLPVKEDGKDYLILSEKDLLGIEYDETAAA